jgi:hypothetical protein
MSRRQQQQIRQLMRSAGLNYREARRRVLANTVTVPRRSDLADDGWPRSARDIVVGAVTGYVRGLVGNALPAESVAHISNDLGIDPAAHPDEIMVVAVRAAPAHFPYIESNLVREYEYGLELHEVGVGFDADIELILGVEEAARVGLGEVVVDEADGWVTVAVTGLELNCDALVRSELEDAEIVESSVESSVEIRDGVDD